MKRLRWLLLILLLVVAPAWGVYVWRNPETRALNPAARAGVSGTFLHLRDGVTHVEVAGQEQARVVVLVHGFSVPAYLWDPTFAALRDAGYHVIRYDLFGRGLSDRPDAAYDGSFYDLQLDDLLAALHVDGKVDIFGVSFGGFVAAHYASTHPQRIRTLSLIDPANRRPLLPWYFKVPVLGPYVFQIYAVPAMADNQPNDFLHPERFPSWAERYRPQMQYTGFGRALYRTRLALTDVDFDAMYVKLARTGIPVALFWGRQDPILPVAQAADVRRALPGLDYVEVDQSGHLPHMEQSAIFNARMLDFLERHR